MLYSCTHVAPLGVKGLITLTLPYEAGMSPPNANAFSGHRAMCIEIILTWIKILQLYLIVNTWR